MAKGTYNADTHRKAATQRAAQRSEDVFTSRGLDPMMDIRTKGFRESLMVGAYPNARPIYVWLDETGSMDHIPKFLAQDPRGLAGMVKGIYPFMRDPQIACCGIGDARNHEGAPLQVGHIEGEGHLMDKWLTSIYLEGKGGGNGGESYELGMYVTARMTRVDCFAQGLKGYIFTIGDDYPFPQVRALDVSTWCGQRIDGDIPIEEMVNELKLNWHPFFIIPDPGRSMCEAPWRRLYGDSVIVAPHHEDISVLIPGLIGLTEGTLTDLDLFDRLMLEQFNRTASQRSRVIATLESYAATLNRAGQSRIVLHTTPQTQARSSGNVRRV